MRAEHKGTQRWDCLGFTIAVGTHWHGWNILRWIRPIWSKWHSKSVLNLKHLLDQVRPSWELKASVSPATPFFYDSPSVCLTFSLYSPLYLSFPLSQYYLEPPVKLREAMEKNGLNTDTFFTLNHGESRVISTEEEVFESLEELPQIEPLWSGLRKCVHEESKHHLGGFDCCMLLDNSSNLLSDWPVHLSSCQIFLRLCVACRGCHGDCTVDVNPLHVRRILNQTEFTYSDRWHTDSDRWFLWITASSVSLLQWLSKCQMSGL